MSWSHALEGQKIKYLMICCKKNPCKNPSKHFWMTIQLPHLNISKKGFRMDVTTATNPYQHDTTDLVYPTSTRCSLSAGCLPIGLPMDGHKNSAETISPGKKNIQCSKCDFLFRTFLQWLRISKNRNEPFLKRMPLGNIIRKHCQVATIAR